MSTGKLVLVLIAALGALMLFGGGESVVVAAKPTPSPTPSPAPTPGPGTPIQIYGAWHCGNHYCDWALLRDPVQFDQANHWLIDRGDGRPSDTALATNPNLSGLQAFVDAYRSLLPYDATGNDHAARLTIDLGAGDRWLTNATRDATIRWLDTASPVPDYANAMVSGTSSETPADWQEHISVPST